jgi:hypothetical protein
MSLIMVWTVTVLDIKSWLYKPSNAAKPVIAGWKASK